MKRICLVTHPQANHTVERRVGGWFDSELTPKGREDARSLQERIKSHGFDLEKLSVFSSDLKRCVQTAEIVFKHSKLKPKFDARLREMSFGTHEGISKEEHESQMVSVPSRGSRMDHQICVGAESRRLLATRIQNIVDELMEIEGESLVITHGFAATFFIAAFQKIDISSMEYISYQLDPGSISILQEDEIFENRTVLVLNG